MNFVVRRGTEDGPCIMSMVRMQKDRLRGVNLGAYGCLTFPFLQADLQSWNP